MDQTLGTKFRTCFKPMQFSGTFAKFRIAARNVVMCVCPSVRPGFLHDGFQCNLIFEKLSKICRENSSVIQM